MAAARKEEGQHTIRFSTSYFTKWGERVVVMGSHPVLVRRRASRRMGCPGLLISSVLFNMSSCLEPCRRIALDGLTHARARTGISPLVFDRLSRSVITRSYTHVRTCAGEQRAREGSPVDVSSSV